VSAGVGRAGNNLTRHCAGQLLATAAPDRGDIPWRVKSRKVLTGQLSFYKRSDVVAKKLQGVSFRALLIGID
jgi:hypothetical protein